MYDAGGTPFPGPDCVLDLLGEFDPVPTRRYTSFRRL